MKVGVILARFQPIHNGHLELIKKALDEYEDDVKFKNNDNYKKLSSKVNSMLQSFETLQNQTENKKVSG
jgi:cytidyltransferase-like protein